jgi:hypothetical protein
MSDSHCKAREGILLDAGELLGLSQLAKVVADPSAPEALGRILSKIGLEGPPPPSGSPGRAPDAIDPKA